MKKRDLALYERVLKTVRHYDMLRKGDHVLAAVSGGPDSVFLLLALNALRRKLGITLTACTLDHGLRGEESRQDAAYAASLAETLGCRILRDTADLRGLKDKRLSPEEAYRRERYSFFSRSARAVGAAAVATGHTLDDQAETVLITLIRGSSAKGAGGIPPVREMAGGVRVIRPLIDLEKREIVEWLAAHEVAYRLDRTNLDGKHFRNRVRREVLPFLEKFNPRIKRALSNFAAHLREDRAFIEEEKRRRYPAARGQAGEVSLVLKEVLLQPRALVKEIAKDCLEAAGADMKKLSYKHWKEIEAFLRYARKGSRIALPGSVEMARTADRIVFHRPPGGPVQG